MLVGRYAAAPAAVENVATLPAFDQVVAAAAEQPVVALAAEERIVVAAAADLVGVVAAGQEIPALSAGQVLEAVEGIVAVARVLSRREMEIDGQVGHAGIDEGVVAVAAVEDLVAPSPVGRIVARIEIDAAGHRAAAAVV